MDRVITIGNFDGLHLGHIKLIDRLSYIGKVRNLEPMVYVIERPYLGNRILDKSKKFDILKSMGIHNIYFEDFTRNFSAISAYDFINEVLKEKFSVKVVVLGYDFRFGNNREGDVNYLKNFLEVDVVDKINNISSTRIRHLIHMGDIREARKLLGRDFSLKGKIIRGKKIGRTIGFRTANLEIDDEMIVPSNGVYKTKTLYCGNIYDSITNIGYNPTISRLNNISVETNIFDFNKDIYDEEIEVYFLDKIREEKKFNSVDELVESIKDDIKKVRKV